MEARLEGLIVQVEEDLLDDAGNIFGEEIIEAYVLGGGHIDGGGAGAFCLNSPVPLLKLGELKAKVKK